MIRYNLSVLLRITCIFLATQIIKRAFTPGLQLGKRYIESWSDGTQAAFFKRFYESVYRLDAVHIVQDNIKKAIDVWVKGGGGSGIGGNIVGGRGGGGRGSGGGGSVNVENDGDDNFDDDNNINSNFKVGEKSCEEK